MTAQLKSVRQPGELSVQSTTTEAETRGVVLRVGFWSALITGALALAWAIAFGIELVSAPPAPWTGIEAYARAFGFPRMLNLIPALPLGWAYIVMVASL